jgi:hypothetical protein
LFNQIRTADYRQTKEILDTPGAAAESMCKNEYGAIVFSKLVVSTTKKVKPTSAPRPAASTTPSSVKDPAKANPFAATKPASAAPSAGSGFKEEVVKSAAVQNFFKKSAAAPANTAKQSTIKKSVEKPVEAVTKAKAAKEQDAEGDADDDGEWNDGEGKVDKDNLKKRKGANAAKFVERDESQSQEVVHYEMDLVTDSDPAFQEVKGPNKFKVHGAMDNFIEDAAISEHKKEVEAEANGTALPSSSTGHKKRRKLVPKVYIFSYSYIPCFPLRCIADNIHHLPHIPASDVFRRERLLSD